MIGTMRGRHVNGVLMVYANEATAAINQLRLGLDIAFASAQDERQRAAAAEAEVTRLRAVLERIAGHRLADFAGVHHMALTCVSEAGEAIGLVEKAPPPPERCDKTLDMFGGNPPA